MYSDFHDDRLLRSSINLQEYIVVMLRIYTMPIYYQDLDLLEAVRIANM